MNLFNHISKYFPIYFLISLPITYYIENKYRDYQVRKSLLEKIKNLKIKIERDKLLKNELINNS